MSWKITKSTITPHGTTQFDEWFDNLPIDYFKDNPAANGKNKFELLEEALTPGEPDPPLVIIKEVAPLSTTKETKETDTATIESTIEVWESRRVYEIWNQQHNMIYQYDLPYGKSGLEATIEILEKYGDVVNEPWEKWDTFIPVDEHPKETWRRITPEANLVVPREIKSPIILNFYKSVYGITYEETHEEI
jgi:hypothetical protein